MIIAPAFDSTAIAILSKKKNLRLLATQFKKNNQSKIEIKSISGGFLLQEFDAKIICKTDLQLVSRARASDAQIEQLLYAMQLCKNAKSNAIVIVNDGVTKGIGGGQTNRIWATEEAIARANGAGVLASDAFFPFRDCVDACAKVGIKAIIQPGGSLRDEESIAACNEHGIAMVFTGKRHFKH